MAVRFGTIGSNFIVERFLESAALCPDFRLAAVYSRSGERAEMLARKWGAPHAHCLPERLAADDTVDAVYIASPNVCHAAQVLTMLDAGKHVLCEKPMATTAEEFAAMKKAARKNGAVLMEAMRSAHLPSLGVLKETIPQLGVLRSAEFTYCQYSSRYDKWKSGVTENAFNPAMRGGALMDIGVYCVHMMLMLLGQPLSLKGEARFLPGSIDVTGTATAEYAGFSARLNYSKIHDSFLPAEIAGENGTLHFGPVSAPAFAKWLPRGGNDGEWTELLPGVLRNDMHCEIEDFIALTEGRGEPELFLNWSGQAIAALDGLRADTGIDYLPHFPGDGEQRAFL